MNEDEAKLLTKQNIKRNDEAETKIKELEEENQKLKKEIKRIQNKVIRLLDFIEIKQCVTRTEIKKWWNND